MTKNDGTRDWNEIIGAPAPRSRSTRRTPSSSRRATGTTTRTGPATRRAAPSPRGRRRTRSVGRTIGLGIVFTLLAGLVTGLGAFLYLYATLAIPAADDLALAETTSIYYSDGTTELGEFGDLDRQIIDASTLPDYVAHAVVASEDRTFYTNSGIDLKGIARALIANITQGTRQGGSTLTQQYVERYYVGETTSYIGKAKEAVLAVKINREQSKDEILGNYLNTIYFGRGAYGIEAASQAYFAHPATDLTLSEAAMLAGIIPAPSAWDPAVDPDMAADRWQRVLALMVEDGWIGQEEADAAEFPATVDPSDQDAPSMSGPTGYLIEHVRTELIDSGAFTDEEIRTGGLRIVSTIDKAKQDAAVAAAESMTEVPGWDPAHQHVALSSMDPATGEIVAEYGGPDYTERQQNAVTQDIAMAGSSFKAFALLANARDGGSVNDVYDGSSPRVFDGLAEPVENDSGYSWGRVSLTRATQNSVNTAFVALNEEVGPAATLRAAVDAGIPEDTIGLDGTLLNVLGFAAPRNIDLTTAYATIAGGGERVSAHIVRTVSDSAGNKLYETPLERERVFDAEEVSSIMPALEAVTTSGGTAETVARTLPGFATAGKTGTSQEQKSAQFVGFIPGLVTTVSMYQSDDEGNSVGLTNIGGLSQFHGGDWPVDVWNRYMASASEGMTQKTFDWIVKSSRTARNQAPVEQPRTPEPEPQSGGSDAQGDEAPGADGQVDPTDPAQPVAPGNGSQPGGDAASDDPADPGQNEPENPGGSGIENGTRPGGARPGGADGSGDPSRQ
ncbi:transglycosylase domain-containing protein [Actinomyces sp. B33]|uniref:transglycosylase domain-containing protein n=1 Tax=Actinomyces sp. B33 TaxID=2942131 RepID=UPI002341C4AC|nr:transglycosylase domain-containing protein [Actinomyces sp. B33]MDC4232572.1 transglycosylase domain-containing protein [Actinomyces sp. B33]